MPPDGLLGEHKKINLRFFDFFDSDNIFSSCHSKFGVRGTSIIPAS